MALTGHPVAVIIAAGLFGIGFGVAQNARLTLMYARVSAAGQGTVSAMGNFAYDAGMGVGAVAFGRLAAGTGYSWAFALIAWPCSVQFGLAPRAPNGRRLIGKRPGQAPFLCL
ncbi:hypothetical protein ABZ734_11625 [Streptomyces sp. NPDC006660]|uniref:hypothetical protein n=1 Tax=Streptomyces sp. NPDC006660 TaxID=3156901 RepID=UPI0033F563A5